MGLGFKLSLVPIPMLHLAFTSHEKHSHLVHDIKHLMPIKGNGQKNVLLFHLPWTFCT